MADLDPGRHSDLLSTAPGDLLFRFRNVQSKAFQAGNVIWLLPLVVVAKCGSLVIRLPARVLPVSTEIPHPVKELRGLQKESPMVLLLFVGGDQEKRWGGRVGIILC